MTNIRPVSDLRNYSGVLKNCVDGEPIFLTKNGRGRYVVLDIEEYKKQQETIKLLSKLIEAEEAIKTDSEWLTLDDVQKNLEV